MKYGLLFILVVFNSFKYESSGSSSVYELPDLAKPLNKINFEITKEQPPVILKEAETIKCDLSIKANSLKSILATLTISNESSQSFYLYKPLLPSDSLIENIFSIINSKNENLKHKISKSNHKSLSEGPNSDIIPLLIPEKIKDYYIELMPKQKMIFTTNLVNSYDFSHVAKNRFYYILASIPMPLVKEMGGTQVREIDQVDKVVKPVYSIISSSPGHTIQRVRIKVP